MIVFGFLVAYFCIGFLLSLAICVIMERWCSNHIFNDAGGRWLIFMFWPVAFPAWSLVSFVELVETSDAWLPRCLRDPVGFTYQAIFGRTRKWKAR